ncbi:MAG: hypothetical protein Q8P95_04840, partial [bacterium]|nr:hypothetical protein [bacterium]
LLVLISIALIAGGGLLLFDLNSWIYSLQVLWKGVSDPLQLDSSLQSGLFLSLADYGYQAAFFFVFGLLGWLYDLKKRGWNVVSFYFLILFGWIAIRFFFYQRVLIQFDVVLLMYSAVFLGALWRVQIGRLFKGLVAVGVTLGMIVPFVVSLADFSPMISEREWQGIRQFCGQLEPKTYVMATHSLYGTWLRGYCPDQLVIAPGMFEHDRWSLLDWRDFWRGDEGRLLELLRRYDTQLYLYVGEKQPQLRLSQDLFEELGSGWAKLKFR